MDMILPAGAPRFTSEEVDAAVASGAAPTPGSDRPKTERCRACRFWRDMERPREPQHIGQCRFLPPTIAGAFNMVNGEGDAMGAAEVFAGTCFPISHEDDWCGKFEWLQHLTPVAI